MFISSFPPYVKFLPEFVSKRLAIQQNLMGHVHISTQCTLGPQGKGGVHVTCHNSDTHINVNTYINIIG